jgi:7-cyano-7-deazaguanine synthase
MGRRAVVVFSGGQDSTTCLIKAIQDYGKENVYAISFFYGQKHWKEIENAKRITEEFQVSHDILDVHNVFECLQNCSLTNNDLQIEQGEKYPNTFVDGRNHMFLSIASIYAKQKDIHDIITGCCETDFSGYPDCRRVFIDSLQETLSLAMDYKFNIITPLMYLNKCQTWELADKLGYLAYIKNNTHTCYNGVEGGCHECPACKLREKGYQEYIASKEIANV